MKYILYAINFFFLLMIPVVLFVYPNMSSKEETSIIVKKLNSDSFHNVKEINLKENEVFVNNSSEKQVVLNDKEVLSVGVAGGILTEVLEKVVGKMSAYGPDCRGCSGKVGSGQVVTNGNIYYDDKTFGKLRILAGDSKYPYGTVVRVVNSKINTPFYAIVLDRGGNIGLGKKFTFDLLFASEKEASLFGTSTNVTFEVMRYGY